MLFNKLISATLLVCLTITMAATEKIYAAPIITAPSGNQESVVAKLPILMITFKDTETNTTAAEFQNLLFSDDANDDVKSMTEYFKEVSYGKFILEGKVDDTWYIATETHKYYYDKEIKDEKKYYGSLELAVEAITQANEKEFDFSSYDINGDCIVDAVGIVYQGVRTIRPHAGKMNSIYLKSKEDKDGDGYKDNVECSNSHSK